MTAKKKALPEQPSGPKYKYKRLYDLGSDRMATIDGMLTGGDSTMSVAEKIQQEWNQYSSVKVVTLDKQIQRYRNDILEPKLRLAAERADDEGIAITKSMQKFREQVDVMGSLNEAINMQWSRIRKAFRIEEKKGHDGKLDASLNKELRPFTDMCRVLSALQLETGVVRRVPKQVQGFFQNLDTKELQEFSLEMSQNDETLKALGELKNILQEATGEIIDGEYIPIESSDTSVSTEDAEALEPESQ